MSVYNLLKKWFIFSLLGLYMYFIRIYIVEQKSTLLTFNCRYTRVITIPLWSILWHFYFEYTKCFLVSPFIFVVWRTVSINTCLKYTMPVILISSCALLSTSNRNTTPPWQRALLWTIKKRYFFPNIYFIMKLFKQRERIKKSTQV